MSRRGTDAPASKLKSGTIRRTVGRSARAAEIATRNRRVVAFGAVAGALTLTAVLLLIVRPAPLATEGRRLMAVDTPDQVNALFDTEIPVSASRWRYIYVHHSGPESNTGTGDAMTDHFVIGNGEDGDDGEVHIGSRWNLQQPAGKTRGLDRVDPDCISICLTGDLDRSVPTPKQMEQLERVVRAIQYRLQIGAERVLLVDVAGLPAGCGRYFPRAAFRSSLMP